MLAQMQRNLQNTLPDARIEVLATPAPAHLKLGLINADYQTGPLDAEVMRAVIASPAYWAFCWGSGLATAQWLTEHPEVCAGKRIADLGSGCGIAGIAAAKHGAREVWACDIDPYALHASATNAALNQVQLTLCDDVTKLPEVDLLIMADVLYDRANYPLITAARAHCKQLIIADSRIKHLETPGFEQFDSIEALTFPNLGEFDEFREVLFFRETD